MTRFAEVEYKTRVGFNRCLVGALFTAALACLVPLSACATLRLQPRYTGPMIDAHGHLGGSFDWGTMVQTMDRNGVTRRTVMARYYPGPAGELDLPGSDEGAIRLAARYPGRFYPLVGMQLPLLSDPQRWREPDAAVRRLADDTARKLATGKYYGIGEFIVRHWAYTGGPHAELDNPIDSAFMRGMSAIGARYDVPLVIHMEGEPTLVGNFSRLLATQPRTRFVWAHNCGRSKAAVIRRMLGRHPNLFCDLGGMTNTGNTGYGTGWPRSEEYTALIERDGVLFPDMRALFEEFSDRFVIGMDVAHAPGNTMDNYSRRAVRFRVLLGQLSPGTARKIAERNAVRIFRLNRASAMRP